MATKSIGELTEEEFMRILGPDSGSDRNGSRVALGRSNRDSCVSMVDGKLEVKGSDEFRRAVEAAFEAKKAPSSGFGYAPYRPAPLVEPEPTIKLMPKTDTTSATRVNVPILVYQSPRKPGLNADGSKAADMVYGDLTAEDIRQIETKFSSRMFDLRDPEKSKPHYHFMNLRAMGKLFSSGDMQMVVLSMIAKFERSEGGEFRDPRLTREVRANAKTQAFVSSLIEQVNKYIKAVDGEINNSTVNDWMSTYSPKPKLPAFNQRINLGSGKSDLLSGLTMAINDVWSGKAEIVQFQRYGKRYVGKLRVTFVDHFGLDYPDVGADDTGHTKQYGLIAGFRSWFILQHYAAFAYKPFLSVMEMEYPFEGEL